MVTMLKIARKSSTRQRNRQKIVIFEMRLSIRLDLLIFRACFWFKFRVFLWRILVFLPLYITNPRTHLVYTRDPQRRKLSWVTFITLGSFTSLKFPPKLKIFALGLSYSTYPLSTWASFEMTSSGLLSPFLRLDKGLRFLTLCLIVIPLLPVILLSLAHTIFSLCLYWLESMIRISAGQVVLLLTKIRSPTFKSSALIFSKLNLTTPLEVWSLCSLWALCPYQLCSIDLIFLNMASLITRKVMKSNSKNKPIFRALIAVYFSIWGKITMRSQ